MPGVFEPRDERVRFTQQVINVLQMQLREYGPAVANSMDLRVSQHQWETFIDAVAYDVRFELQAQRLGGERIQRSTTVKYEFKALDGPFQRWKRDHQQAWWLRWFVRWRPLVYIRQPFEREVTLVVDVDDYATFPESSFIPMPERFGPPVLKRITIDRIVQ